MSARDVLNSIFRDRGYPLKWVPPSVAATPGNLIEVTFPLLAAHLMLSLQRPYFIGIRANDGITHDPIYPFILDHGWEGIMVEPVPHAFEVLEKNYRAFDGVKLVNAAVGKEDGVGTIFTVDISDPKSGMMSLHSSFSREILLRGRRWHPDLERHIVRQEVQVVSFETLLSKVEGRRIDVLKIDTEGYDLENCRSWKYYAPAYPCGARKRAQARQDRDGRHVASPWLQSSNDLARHARI